MAFRPIPTCTAVLSDVLFEYSVSYLFPLRWARGCAQSFLFRWCRSRRPGHACCTRVILSQFLQVVDQWMGVVAQRAACFRFSQLLPRCSPRWWPPLFTPSQADENSHRFMISITLGIIHLGFIYVLLTRWVQNDISSFLFARLLTRSVIRSGYLAVQISSSFSCVFVSFDHFSTGVLALFLLFSGIALCFLMLSFVRSSKKMYLVPPPPRNLSCSPHRRTHCLLPPRASCMPSTHFRHGSSPIML